MGKKAAFISGLAALSVLAMTLLLWKEIAVWIELYRMRRNPEHLVQVIDSPRETVRGEAVRRLFASKNFPGTAMLDAYIRGLEKADINFKNWDSNDDEA